ncbi:hypothetical protein BDQ12DRAFT_673216 [Crucibulum laeve]|uniref:Uncharacterized protein n=1 Tax=Crucibulum laeve TaxID=68775 RepID=A0A5C3MT64_9AGAR|nr:hypothetical protein BDQ12DRAFT_673216 [Crucibulum laeve]
MTSSLLSLLFLSSSVSSIMVLLSITLELLTIWLWLTKHPTLRRLLFAVSCFLFSFAPAILLYTRCAASMGFFSAALLFTHLWNSRCLSRNDRP